MTTSSDTTTSSAATTRLRHLGIIADGNRRWARDHGLPDNAGHKKGIEAVEGLVVAAAKAGIEYITFYVFSTENWQRSADEVGYIMGLVKTQIAGYAEKLAAKNARFLVLGSQQGLPDGVAQALAAAEELTAACTGITVCFCFNYGGEQEIADAINAALREAADTSQGGGGADADNPAAASQGEGNIETVARGAVTPDLIRQHLYHPEIPDVDMVVRTSGEQRLSGFMLWRASYAELLFLNKNFPDMTAADLDQVVAEFQKRHRRFGK